MKYAMNPPKMAGSQVYYKDIIIWSMLDDEILGAKKFDYTKKEKIISTLDIIYDKRLSTKFDSIQDIDTSVLTNSINRVAWIFNSEEEAFIQKMICLKKLREAFNNQEKENRKIFDTKIPWIIDKSVEEITKKYPEYFL